MTLCLSRLTSGDFPFDVASLQSHDAWKKIEPSRFCPISSFVLIPLFASRQELVISDLGSKSCLPSSCQQAENLGGQKERYRLQYYRMFSWNQCLSECKSHVRIVVRTHLVCCCLNLQDFLHPLEVTSLLDRFWIVYPPTSIVYES